MRPVIELLSLLLHSAQAWSAAQAEAEDRLSLVRAFILRHSLDINTVRKYGQGMCARVSVCILVCMNISMEGGTSRSRVYTSVLLDINTVSKYANHSCFFVCAHVYVSIYYLYKYNIV